MVGQPVVDADKDRSGAVLSGSQSRCGIAAADLGLNGVEIADEGHTFFGNRRGSDAADLDQFAARMGPAMRELDAGTDPVRSDQAVISGIAVNLQNAAKTLQDPLGMLPAPTVGIGEDHTWWRGTSPGPVIAGQCPEIPGFGHAAPRIQHRGSGFIHEQLG